jgi:hypothetical protein
LEGDGDNLPALAGERAAAPIAVLSLKLNLAWARNGLSVRIAANRKVLRSTWSTAPSKSAVVVLKVTSSQSAAST